MLAGRAAQESAAARWLRRSLTIPAVLLVAVLGAALLPVALAIALPVDLVRRNKLGLCRTACFLLLYVWCEAIGVAALLWAFVSRPPLTPALREAFTDANYRYQSYWGMGVYNACAITFGFRTILENELPRPGKGPLLVMIRHASTADTMFPIVLMGYPLGFRPRYVLKRELLLDPCIDISLQRLPNRFVRRGSAQAEVEARRVSELFQGMGPKDMLIIYPEGTRFTPERRAATLAQLRAKGPSPALTLAEELHCTLPPLRRGALALLGENPGADLLVLGHTGFEGTGSFGELVSGGLVDKEVRVRSWLVPYASIPKDEAGRRAMLIDLWREVDRFVEGHRGHDADAAPPLAKAG